MNNTYAKNLSSNETKWKAEMLVHIRKFERKFPELREYAHTPSLVCYYGLIFELHSLEFDLASCYLTISCCFCLQITNWTDIEYWVSFLEPLAVMLYTVLEIHIIACVITYIKMYLQHSSLQQHESDETKVCFQR